MSYIGTLCKVSDDGLLECPRCRYTYLHHQGIELFSRAEDARLVRRAAVDGGGGVQAVETAPNALSRNPSCRRDGLVIHFECEACGGGLMLGVAQHKGQTFLEWRMPADGGQATGRKDAA